MQIVNVPKYITIRDDLMFKTVFSDERLLRELLKRVLPDIDISHLKLVISEKTFDGPGKSHGIRVDIYAEDGTRIYVHNGKRPGYSVSFSLQAKLTYMISLPSSSTSPVSVHIVR